MNISRRAPWVTLAVLAWVLIAPAAAPAQGVTNFGFGFDQGALSPPQFEPEGMWARVVSVTPKWIVLQNDTGQQFPVSVTAINGFFLRWPTNPALFAPDAWAEVTGLDATSGRVIASHVDVYEGAARRLVTPVSRRLIGYNRVMLPISPYRISTYGQLSLLPGEELIPPRRHVVGPILNRDPLVIATSGNDAVTVFPGNNGLTLTRVTLGSASLIQVGDLVWTVPADANPKTLALDRLVVYKSVPYDQFVP